MFLQKNQDVTQKAAERLRSVSLPAPLSFPHLYFSLLHVIAHIQLKEEGEEPFTYVLPEK